MSSSETELEEQRAFYETVLQALSDAGQAFSVVEPGGRIVQVNEAWERISGYTAQELYAMPSWLELVPEHDRERIAAEVGARAQGKRFREPLAALLIARDGRLVRLEGTVAPVVSGGGPHVAVLARDVTAREESEARLRYQRGLLEAQAEATIDGVLVVSPEGRMISHNRRFAELWGFPQELVDAGLDDMALEAAMDRVADPEAFIARVRELYEHPERTARDEIVMADGRVLDRYGAPVVDSDGTHHGRIWVFRDITTEQRAVQRLEFLVKVSAVLDASLDPRTTLERVPRMLVPYLGDICTVRLVDGAQPLELVSVIAVDPALAEEVRAVDARHPLDPRGPGPIADVLRSGRTRLIEQVGPEERSATARDEDHLRGLERVNQTSLVIAPLRARGNTLGVLTASFVDGSRRYAEEDVGLVEDIARRLALAYDNARLYEDRSHVAATLQASLLPERLPDVPGLELAARYRPATGRGEVGGDFYDVFPADAGGWHIAIGDVCGKGAEAAALTALTRHTIRTAAMADGRPAAVLAVLNEAILRQVTDSRFCTVAFGLVRPEDGGAAVTLARGGHPAPLVIRAGGEIERVAPAGGAPGMAPRIELRDGDARLGPGDALLLYTDGLTDARRDGAVLDDAGVEEMLAGLEGRGAEAIASGIERGLQERGADLPDDLALLVVSVPA